MTKIPKNIFFIYLEGVHEIPVPLLNNIKEIDQNNPGWTVTIYDKKMAEEFIDREYGAKTLSTYKSINSQYYAARADFLRYLICHKYGGVYLDVKVQLDKPLGEILNCDDEFLLLQWDTQRASLGYGQWPELSHIDGGEYVNWFIASKPNHRFLRAAITDVTRNISRYHPRFNGVGRMAVLRATGPIAYSLAIHRHLTGSDWRIESSKEPGIDYSIFDGDGHSDTYKVTSYKKLKSPLVNRKLTLSYNFLRHLVFFSFKSNIAKVFKKFRKGSS